jgi:hypothetical protein
VAVRSWQVVTKRAAPTVEVIDLAPGLWIWRLEHPGWNEECDWQEVVTCVCVETEGERWLLDPLLPPYDAIQVWDRLAERPPTAVALLIPDHNRPTYTQAPDELGPSQMSSLDIVAERFGCPAFGPDDWSDNTPPRTKLEKILPGEALPGGLMPFRDPRGWSETPLWLPEHKTLVFGDALTERNGVLRVWMSPTHDERAIPDLRAMLGLPLERVVISHGAPLHTREALESALGRPPWPASPLHIAAYGGNYERVRALVDAGADLSRRDDRYNRTPLDWAESGAEQDWTAGRGHRQTIAYLKSMMNAKA